MEQEKSPVMNELKKDVLNDYKMKFDWYIKAAAILDNLEDKEAFNLAIKKAAGCKMMIDYMTNNKVL